MRYQYFGVKPSRRALLQAAPGASVWPSGHARRRLLGFSVTRAEAQPHYLATSILAGDPVNSATNPDS